MMNMLEKLEKIVKANKDKVAYKINDETISYGELWKNAISLSNALINQNTSPVILYGHKSTNMIISIIACLIAKRAYVPIDICTPMERIYKIINQSQAGLVIKNSDIKLENVECLNISEIEKKYNCDNSNRNINNKNETAYIIFTSGSTGEPKGVPISYSNLENFITWISKLENLSTYRNINILNVASFSFDLSVADLYYSLFNGHTLIGLDNTSKDDYAKIFYILEKEKINLIVSTPTFAKLLTLNKDFNSENFKNLQAIYFCGETLEVKLVKNLKKKFKDIKIINAYGPTEATSAVSGILIDDCMLDEDVLPVGKMSTTATQITIENNEIVLSGPSVFDGYIGNISEGHSIINGINYYKTGDVGYIKDNLLYCKGRIDSQIKYKGYRIELGEIENNLLKINGIKEAVVVAKTVENSDTIKFIKAYITLDAKISTEQIKTELRKVLPEYMIPKIIEVLENIPVNNNGKYDRKKLKEL